MADTLGRKLAADLFASRELAAGQLEPVLEELLPRTPGLFLYFPARTQTQPKLRAFIDMVTAASKRRDAGPGANRASARRARPSRRA
jgi:DNA-binding transcriptional LysR family regulator